MSYWIWFCRKRYSWNIEVLCILPKTLLSLPSVWHGTTFWKKPYINLWYLITYSTIFIADLITYLVLGTKIFYSRTNWNYIATQFMRREPHCKVALSLLMEQFYDISGPKINKKIVYNGQKRVLMDSLVTIVAPLWVNDIIVSCYTSLGCSQIYRDQYWHNNQPHCIYGDPAYPLSIHL